MRITYSQLKKLPVETRSGEVLGHVGDIVFDIDGQQVLQYEVKSSMLSTKKYMVGREQVVSITEKKMIVEDAVVGQKEERLKIAKGDMGTEAVAMREEA
ncbi:MAG: hypothetical protein COV60_01910 [Candidatus Magasanikbacteria bacterium CG11_big_fil_rev_8_21_14_0_20_43_7]|uniref:PRC-barrel domain-containing protein n=1 Tax=Candidatus Magasanikbacteria bacterium CG11_big_fil_rev_8_21_14_0_20_43_7 TaxID=1974654 RepID=A0A2H0N2L0_9BACT|nr:MAG: hypothetical protein COV60_01910 [Candidatus Magasanikbacteria bacterium CG11_big_fil_rev_8_21_14_0_20_43_7]